MASGSVDRRVAVMVVAVGLSTAGCMGIQGSDGPFENTQEWCAAVADVDQRFVEADSSSDSFDVKQERYQEINDLLSDLDESIDVVDEDARDAVRESLDWAMSFTDVLIDAETEEAAGEELFGDEGLLTDEEGPDPAGADWILAECGVDINGDET